MSTLLVRLSLLNCFCMCLTSSSFGLICLQIRMLRMSTFCLFRRQEGSTFWSLNFTNLKNLPFALEHKFFVAKNKNTRVKSHLWSKILLYVWLYFNIELLKNTQLWKNSNKNLSVFFLHLVPMFPGFVKTYSKPEDKDVNLSKIVSVSPPTQSEDPPQATVATTLVPLSPPWSLLTVESCLLCHHSTFYTWSLLLTLPMDCQGGCGRTNF